MRNPAFYIIALVYLAALISLGWFIPREDFGISLMAYISMVIGMWMYGLGNAGEDQLITFGVVCRLIAVFSVPELSDDIYRFVWDGLVSSNGINPYEYTPREILIMGEGKLVPGSSSLFPLLNSPDYHTVYPPVIQALNLTAVWFSGGVIQGTIIFHKLALALADTGSMLILLRIVSLLKLKTSLSMALIALNPLLIMEVSVNGHHEGFILLLLSATIYSLLRSRPLAGGFLLGAAIGIKLTPLILVPVISAYLIRTGGAVRFITGTLVSSAILLWPLADPVVGRAILNSTGLYFETFAFNSPVYHIASWAAELTAKPWEVMQAINIVLPVTASLAILFVSLMVYKGKVTLFDGILCAMVCYLLLSRVIHPWYLVPLSGIAVISGNIPFLFWGNLSFLSYSAYSSKPYRESVTALIAEYVILLVLLVLTLKNTRPSLSTVHSENP